MLLGASLAAPARAQEGDGAPDAASAAAPAAPPDDTSPGAPPDDDMPAAEAPVAIDALPPVVSTIALPDPAGPPRPAFRAPRLEAGRGSDLPMIGVVVGGGLVAVGLGTAIVSGVLLAGNGRAIAEGCPEHGCTADGRAAVASSEALLALHYAGWGCTTTGLVLGTTLILAGTSSEERTRAAASVAIVPRGFPAGGGVGMNGQF